MRIITRIVICSLYICFVQSNDLSQIEAVLHKVGELEESSNTRFTFDEIVERVKAEGFDLEAIFAEHGITKEEVENEPPGDLLTIGRQTVPPDDEEDLEDCEGDECIIFEGSRAFGGKNSVNSVSSLSGTSSLIMNMIFSLNGVGAPPTPPPMPVFVDNTPKTQWSNWKSWTSCTSTCGGGSRKRYRQCQRQRGSPSSCPGSQRQVSGCNTHDCRK